jgi:hypothetical protein
MYRLRPGRRGLGYVGTCPTGQTWNTSANVCVAPGEAVAAPQGPSSGLSLEMPMTPAGVSVCDSWAYYLTPACWYLSRDTWADSTQFQPLQGAALPVAPAAIPAAYTATAPTVDEAAQQTTDSLNAAAAATQAATLAAAQNQGTVCDTGETLAADGVTCVSSTNWALWGAVALVGVFGFVALAGGSPRRYGR